MTESMPIVNLPEFGTLVLPQLGVSVLACDEFLQLDVAERVAGLGVHVSAIGETPLAEFIWLDDDSLDAQALLPHLLQSAIRLYRPLLPAGRQVVSIRHHGADLIVVLLAVPVNAHDPDRLFGSIHDVIALCCGTEEAA